MQRLKPYLLVLLVTTSLVPLMGHSGGCGESDILGPKTGATCPQGSTLTYSNFGKPFVEKYCTSCHSSTLSGASRKGATLYHDFDTLKGIRDVMDHVDQTTGASDKVTNDAMPPGSDKPTLEERKKLAEWLACGAPEPVPGAQ